MSDSKEHSVLKWLPDNGQRVLCYGHKTFCCKEDMEEEAQWHEVIFRLQIGRYKIVDHFPNDPEESIIKEGYIFESWDTPEEIDDEDISTRIIGVTKWKYIE